MDWLVFLPACLALNLAFGPNNLLSLTNGATNGVTFAMGAGFGRLVAFVPMIAISAVGLGVVLQTSAIVFTIVKAAGAAYLIWLGIRLLRAGSEPVATGDGSHARSLGAAFRAEALVALGNPKAILIFAAFFPQFVDTGDYWRSYLAVASAFLALEALAILTYSMIGVIMGRAAKGRMNWLRKASGLAMILFGALLLFARKATPSSA